MTPYSFPRNPYCYRHFVSITVLLLLLNKRLSLQQGDVLLHHSKRFDKQHFVHYTSEAIQSSNDVFNVHGYKRMSMKMTFVSGYCHE